MSELRLNTDGHIIKFGADNDVSLTHVADTGLLLNSTMQLQFNDASQNINAPSATVLDINATDEIELNATAVDLNGTLDVSGNSQFSGTVTVGVDDTGKDVKLFGATASSHLLWDESADTLNLVASTLGVGAVGTKDLGAGIHIKTSDSSATANAAANELVIEANANSGISILSSTSTAGRIYFGDSGDDDIGQIRYNHDDNSMNFKVNALADSLKIDSAGHVTTPLNPAFRVAQSTSGDFANNHTAFNGTGAITEQYDVNADLAANGTFTAPATGTYLFTIGIADADSTDDTSYDMMLITSNRGYRWGIRNKFEDNTTGITTMTIKGSVLADMDANDTAYVKVGAGATITIEGNVEHSFFSGVLIG